MEKAMRCKVEDRLSELPESVIFEIFWLLPMTDVVRTSVLSKRWRNLWTFSPFLNFDNVGMLFEDVDALQKFVNRALLYWNGDRVLKFKFDSFQQLDYAIYRDIDLWVSFAMRNAVEELDLHVRRNRGEVYGVPQSLYSCSSLKKLKLKDCNMEIFGSVQWNQLESLRIESYMVTPHVINQILSGSPQLRVFNLRVPDTCIDANTLMMELENRQLFQNTRLDTSFSIQSSSLKELSIHKFHYYGIGVDLSMLSELRILTPNLETLEITGIPFSECLLMDVSSVINATLGLLGVEHNDEDALLSGNMLSQILPTIQHAENVTLLHCCTKVLGVMNMNCMHSSFPNVKSLEFGCCLIDHERVVGLLVIFPQLERLVLTDKGAVYHQDDQESLKFGANLPESFLLQLRTIEVTWIESSSTLPLIEILLKYASKLEKMVFRVKELRWLPFFMITQKVLRIPRSSPSCKIEFYDCRDECT